MSKKTSRRAFSYVRFSTPQQAEGGSLTRQTEWTEKYCQRKRLSLDDSLHLQDLGVSAFRGSNVKDGALAGFLEACRVGRVPRGSYLIVESLDRLSRDQIRPALQLFLGLQDFGITIVTLQPEREYPPEATDALALIEPLIVFARAHEESQMKSHRRKDGWKQARDRARRDGKPMMKTCPAWLEVTPEGFRMKEEAAAIVRLIFALCREGYGIERIVSKLKRDGVPPIGNGARWVSAYVYKMLVNPAAMGTYQPMRLEGKSMVPDDEPIPNFYPAVVSEEEWREAQAALRQRAGGWEKDGRGSPAAGRKGKDDTEANLFTGLARDAITRERMQIVHGYGPKSDGKRKHYVYLVASPMGGERGRRIDYHAFEFALLKKMREVKASDIASGDKQPRKGEAEETRLAARLLDLTSRIERAKARARKAEDFDAFLDLIESLQAEQRQVSGRLTEIQQEQTGGAATNIGETHSLIDLLKNAKDADRDDLRRRLKMRIRQLVSEMQVLIVRRGRARLVGVQLFFAASKKHRSYLLYHAPLLRSEPWVEAFDGVLGSDDLDLRNPDHVRRVEAALQKLDLADVGYN
jgi:DNA invertase Pin-like site-specific DNA recombinase